MDSNITGTVAITGADGQVGHVLLQRMKDTQIRTIALTRKPVELPADRVVCGALDSTAIQAAISEATYVVHLAGALRPRGSNSYESANLQTTQSVVKAVRNGKTKRILYLSYVGASEDSKNPYLRLKAISERLLKETGKEVVVFRCTYIIGSPKAPGPQASAWLASRGKNVVQPGTGKQVVAPVYVGDVVSALLAAMKGGAPGIYDLAGPEQMTVDELIRVLNRNAKEKINHVPGWIARLVGQVIPSFPGPMLDVLLKDSVADPSRAVRTFGLALTSLRTVWG